MSRTKRGDGMTRITRARLALVVVAVAAGVLAATAAALTTRLFCLPSRIFASMADKLP